jgi:hypothetical protein
MELVLWAVFGEVFGGLETELEWQWEWGLFDEEVPWILMTNRRRSDDP